MKKTPAIVGLLCASIALAGCGHHNPPSQAMPPPAPVTTPPAVSTGPSSAVNEAPARPRKAVIYTVDAAHGSDADNYLVPKEVRLRDRQHPARAALNALLRAQDTPIPAGTRLNSIAIADGLATLDFNRSPVDETHGEERQAQALEAIQRTLGQFPNVSRIQINVNGQPAPLGESGGGPMDVLRPGEKPQDAGGA
ncbi:MAG: GerMN domain-containing protein [Armatimonadetes bacterium]|nr:GerMN domain-containing protein [Armatimonadota bacterium]